MGMELGLLQVVAFHIGEVLVVAEDLTYVLSVLHLLFDPALLRRLRRSVFGGVLVLVPDIPDITVHGFTGEGELVEAVEFVNITLGIPVARLLLLRLRVVGPVRRKVRQALLLLLLVLELQRLLLLFVALTEVELFELDVAPVEDWTCQLVDLLVRLGLRLRLWRLVLITGLAVLLLAFLFDRLYLDLDVKLAGNFESLGGRLPGDGVARGVLRIGSRRVGMG